MAINSKVDPQLERQVVHWLAYGYTKISLVRHTGLSLSTIKRIEKRNQASPEMILKKSYEIMARLLDLEAREIIEVKPKEIITMTRYLEQRRKEEKRV